MLPCSLIDPLWSQFHALIPKRVDTHPLGCHRPRIPDRVVFDKLVQTRLLGAAYEKIADAACSATKIRTRRDRRPADSYALPGPRTAGTRDPHADHDNFGVSNPIVLGHA